MSLCPICGGDVLGQSMELHIKGYHAPHPAPKPTPKVKAKRR